MASVIIMPKQGLLMEEGTITNWLVKEGEKTTEGTPLFEMETDKLTITMDSTATGTVLKILHPEGDTVPITQPIAIVGEPGEDISALLGGEAPAAAPAAPAPEAPAAETAPAPETAAPAVERAPGERMFSSPRARLRAEENGVDIAAVPGSGPDGRVVEQGAPCKMARGQMVRWMAEQAVTRVEELREFRDLGYRFSPERSDPGRYVFLKEDDT